MFTLNSHIACVEKYSEIYSCSIGLHQCRHKEIALQNALRFCSAVFSEFDGENSFAADVLKSSDRLG